jgi:hypothetical protein
MHELIATNIWYSNITEGTTNEFEYNDTSYAIEFFWQDGMNNRQNVDIKISNLDTSPLVTQKRKLSDLNLILFQSIKYECSIFLHAVLKHVGYFSNLSKFR